MTDGAELAKRARDAVSEVRGEEVSQRSFAKLIGATNAAISRWESGKLNPSGIARSLLVLIEKHPRLVERVLKRAATGAEGGSK